MNTLKLITQATLAALLIAGLGACSKKKGDSAVAAPPAGYITCPAQGYYTNSAGQTQYCTAGQQVYVGTTGTVGTTGQQLCPQQGYIQTQYGTQQCVPGQYVQVGTQQPGYPGQYPSQQNCQTMYGPQYQPQPRWIGGMQYCFPWGY